MMGPLTLTGLRRGDCRELFNEEIEELRAACGLKRDPEKKVKPAAEEKPEKKAKPTGEGKPKRTAGAKPEGRKPARPRIKSEEKPVKREQSGKPKRIKKV